MASFDHHFSVAIAHRTFQDARGARERFKGRLVDPRNHRDRVGRIWGLCKSKSSPRQRCRVNARFNGEIGGAGRILASGGLKPPTDLRLDVNSGTHDFNGVGGKLVFMAAPRERGAFRLVFDLTR